MFEPPLETLGAKSTSRAFLVGETVSGGRQPNY
jgi:hypothetical protein